MTKESYKRKKRLLGATAYFLPASLGTKAKIIYIQCGSNDITNKLSIQSVQYFLIKLCFLTLPRDITGACEM